MNTSARVMKFHKWLIKILKKQNVLDGQKNRRTGGKKMDRQCENSLPTHKHSLKGYNKTNNESKLLFDDNFI